MSKEVLTFEEIFAELDSEAVKKAAEERWIAEIQDDKIKDVALNIAKVLYAIKNYTEDLDAILELKNKDKPQDEHLHYEELIKEKIQGQLESCSNFLEPNFLKEYEQNSISRIQNNLENLKYLRYIRFFDKPLLGLDFILNHIVQSEIEIQEHQQKRDDENGWGNLSPEEQEGIDNYLNR